MKTALIIRLIAVAMLSMLSACTYVKSLFPDKEKDYQYTTEIPPMILPADLKANYVPSLPTSAPSGADVSDAALQAAVNTPVKAVASAPVANKPAASPSTPVEAAVAAPTANKPPPMPVEATVPGSTASKPAAASSGAIKDEGFESEPEESLEVVTVERVSVDKGENRLHINVPFIRAWRMMGKALSRKAIELTGRNQDAGLFTVQYDPDEHAVKEPSYLDELESLFSDMQGNDKTYLIKLEKINQQIDIIVIDKDQKPLSDAASFKLLTLLQETMKADLAHKATSTNKSPKE
jgi:outer membrane protein assembly factor BamC